MQMRDEGESVEEMLLLSLLPTSIPLTLSSAESSWQMMWHGLIEEVLSLKHRPSHWYLDMR